MGLPLSLNSSFSAKLPGLQLAWDSTSLKKLKTCPRLYQFSMVIGYNTLSENIHLVFGRIYHSALEFYDHAKCRGADHEEAMLMAVKVALTQSWDTTKNRPWYSDDPNKNRLTLVRSVVWYIDRFKDDNLKTIILDNGKPAVELSFQFEAEGIENTLTSEPFVLCGHLDRLVEFEGDVFIADRKTTKSTLNEQYFDSFTPDVQFSLYPIAGKIVYKQQAKGIIVDAAQIAVTFTRFERQFVPRTDSTLQAWYKDLSYWLGLAQYFAANDYWPINDQACFRCAFRPICSKPPEVQAEWLKNSFPKQIWNPLKVRGDV
jgi:hypothetical protein